MELVYIAALVVLILLIALGLSSIRNKQDQSIRDVSMDVDPDVVPEEEDSVFPVTDEEDETVDEVADATAEIVEAVADAEHEKEIEETVQFADDTDLQEVHGIGPKTEKNLYDEFGTLQAIYNASNEDLIDNLSRARLDRLRNYLNEKRIS